MIERRKKPAQSGIKTSIKQAQADKSGKQSSSNGSCKKAAKTMLPNPDQSDQYKNSHKIRLLNSLIERKNPFANIMKVSLLLNPKEFELPEDYVPDIQFPGTSKKPLMNTATREARHTTYSVRRAQELDRNDLPSILRTCYFCRKGYRKAPLVHCDYCPLVYHADCIDPPLTILPNTRWMCPNHVEPIAEEKLLKSSSYCERVKLWNNLSKPIDHELVKTDFLEKVLKRSSPEREISDSPDEYRQVLGNPERENVELIVNSERHNDEFGGDKQRETSSNPYDSTINISLRQMIESSKLLESQDHHQTNGDNDHRDKAFITI